MKTIKRLSKRAMAAFLAFLMAVSLLGGAPIKVQAAENDEYPALTEDEAQEIFNEYLQNGGNEDVDGNPAIIVLEYVASKVMDKLMDKTMDSAWNAMFGSDHEETVKMLNEINQKLDQIIGLLNLVLKHMTIKEIKDSITEKNRYYNAIHAQAQMVDGLFESSKGKENYKDLRWDALQRWSNLRLEGCSDSIASLRLYCNQLTNQTGLNWHGNYFSQYDEYSKLMWDWDTQRVPFQKMQRERDIFIVAQMATYNLLYLQYAEDRGLLMDYVGLRKQIGDCLNQVVDMDKKTPSEKLDEGCATLTVKGAKIKMVMATTSTNWIGVQIEKSLNQDEECWGAEHNVINYVNNNNLVAENSHLLTNAERDLILMGAKEKNIPLKKYLIDGGIAVNDSKYKYILTSMTKSKPQIVHFGERHIANFYLKFREMYLESHSLEGNGYDKRNTLTCRVAVNGDDRCKEAPLCGWKRTVFRAPDYYLEQFAYMLRDNPVFISVKVSDVSDYPDSQKETNESFTVEGIITNWEKTAETSGQLTVRDEFNETGMIRYTENTEIQGNLAVDARIIATCIETDNIITAVKLQVISEDPVPVINTVSGTVTAVDESNCIITIQCTGGQEHNFRYDNETVITGTLREGAEAAVTFKELAGGNYAVKIEVTRPVPDPQPVPIPGPLPCPIHDPAPEPQSLPFIGAE